VDFLVMIILGGLGSVFGSVAGAAVVTVLNDSLAGVQADRPLIFGAVLIACLLFTPGGPGPLGRRESWDRGGWCACSSSPRWGRRSLWRPSKASRTRRSCSEGRTRSRVRWPSRAPS